MQPIFFDLTEIIAIHNDQIERYGGSPGIRDMRLLQSAIGMPAATFDASYLHQDLYEMAAAYLFHITQNHPFIDGNKRTGAVAALVFLSMNEIEIDAPEDEFEKMVMNVAEGKIDKAGIKIFFKKFVQDQFK